jgi:uncharacterized membrane protein
MVFVHLCGCHWQLHTIMELHKRTIARAVIWRVIATLVTALWTGISGAIVINIVLTILHYIHERMWLKIQWGKE